MTTYKEHYDHLLARHYTWMFGMPFEDKVAEQRALLRDIGIDDPGVAVDLGCGSGFQSVALADLGASHVYAVDTSSQLLAELADNAERKPITTHESDLLSFADLLDEQPDTVVCMGDTLTHLRSTSDVAALFETIANKLAKGGQVVLSWRDLSSMPEGLDRFIPLRSTDERIMVCFLEDRGDTALVHDLIHVRDGDGWQLHKSAYRKLKLPPAWIRDQLMSVGLRPHFEQTVRGMTVLAATRSS